jgi:hypothetical protein
MLLLLGKQAFRLGPLLPNKTGLSPWGMPSCPSCTPPGRKKQIDRQTYGTTMTALNSNRRIFAVLLIAISVASRAQDPVKAFPKSYSTAFENNDVDVIRVHYGPHEKVGVHDHSKSPTVYVYLSDSGPIRFEHFEDRPTFTLTRPPVSEGAYRVSPGRLERHNVENLGDISSDYLRVELKELPLGDLKDFRAKAPPSPLHTQDSIEFTTPGLQIERIICTGSAACIVKPSQNPSLIIAFTSMHFEKETAEKQNEHIAAGSVLWLSPTQAASIKQDSSSPAHILRILLPPDKK